MEITRLPGLGPKRARQLADELGIDSLEALRAAAEGQRIRSLRGFGPKAEESILAAIDALGDGKTVPAGPAATEVSTSSAGAVAGPVEVFNASPVDVVVWSDGAVVGEVPSLQRVEQAWPATGSVEVRPANLGSGTAPVRVLEQAAVGAQAVITPADFRSVRLDGAAVSAVFVNDTGVYVDVYGVDEAGSASLAASAVAPGGRHQQESHPGAVWMVRATFTDELEGMFVLGEEPAQEMSVTGGFPSALADSAPLPSPLAAIENVALVGGERERPRPESRDYIVISEHDNLEVPRFNTRSRVATRTVRIAGAKLIWDRLDDRYGLMSYEGEGVLDLEALDIYADHVVIASPLRFPRTNVTICARELEFKGNGQIDTSPIAHQAQARSPYLNKDGVPIDANGTPTYRAADGMDGEPAGDIAVFAQTLKLPPGDAGKRFVARGSAGQQAEEGGLKLYAPRDEHQPPSGKDAAAIEEAHINSRFSSAFVAAKSPSDWRWPGEVSWPSQVTYEGQPLNFGPNGNVVDLVVVAHDDAMGGTDTNVFFFPAGDQGRLHYMRVWDNAPIESVLHDGSPISRPPARRPGDGEDAYPGGQPGDGGAGGMLVTSLPFSVVEPVCDLAGGAAGPETPRVPGGERGGPNPAYQVQMDVVKRTWPWESGRSPSLFVTPVQASDGAEEPARQGSDGQTGQVVMQDRGWLEPEVIDAVVACARDAHRNGHRDLARALLEPYYAQLRSAEGVPDELQFRAVSIESMRENLRANLDYYGNPPGWLPRLRLSTNFDLFQTLRQLSLRMLFYAQNTEQKYDTLAHRDELARQTSNALEDELDTCVETLQGAVEDLAAARLSLEDARRQVQAKQGEIDLLKGLTESEALDSVERQRIYRGVCKTVSGVMKAVPVGQPYLGLGADVVGTVGDINFTDTNAIPKQVGDAIGKIGAATDTFLKSNSDLIIDDRLKELKSKVKLTQTNSDNLAEQLTRTKGANANLEKAITAHSKPIESQWNKERDAELKWLKDEFARVDGQITTLSKPKTDSEQKQLEAAEEAKERLEARIGETEAATLMQQRATLTRSIEWMTDAIAAEKAADTADVAVRNEERAAQLTKEKQQLEQSKQRVDTLEEQQRAAKQQEKVQKEELATQEREMRQTFSRLKGMAAGMATLGQGIATLATPATQADPEVQAFAKTLLTSKKRDQYQKVTREFEALAKVQTAAMDKLKAAQHQITTNLASIAENVTAQNALSRQRQALDGVLDIRAKRYLRGMQDRARDMLRWSMYNLLMSYRYEFLTDAEGLWNYDKVVEELRKLEAAPTKPGAPPATISPEDFKALDDRVLQNEFLGEARKILEERQHRAGAAMQNVVTLRLSDEQRKELRLTGRVTFNLISDMGAGSFDWADARIVDITLDALTVETQNPALSVRLTFRHSGESIILGRDKRTGQWTYYYFRAAPGDDPIEWGFSYNHARDSMGRIKKDAREAEPDLMTKRILEPNTPGGARLDFREYSPAYFSDLTLHLTPGAGGSAGGINDITLLQFSVSYALTTERRR